MNAVDFVKIAINHPDKVITNLGRRGLLNWMSDEAYLCLLYKSIFKKKLNLENPQTFSEKLQWLKLHDKNPLYTKLVDKYEVKSYVADVIGEEYLIPTIGIWDKVEDIDFDLLPNQFVLKCTHDSGGLVICTDKTKLDIAKAKNKLKKGLKQNFFYFGREWPYKNVKPRIIAEAYMEDKETKELRDYKFYCFHGTPQYCQVISNRSTNETVDFFDMDWNLQPFTGLLHDLQNSETPVSRPANFEQMKQVATKLASDYKFSRIDLYEINGEVYFGEITFYPLSGLGNFSPMEWNQTMGDKIEL